MTIPTVELTPDEQKQYDRLSKPERTRVLKKIAWMQQNWPQSRGKSLTGDRKGTKSLRAGDYRILYRVVDEAIIIGKIGHGREVYNGH
ncbi:MAG: type II toxin-antitoxin system RelE/ParE family toxin [Proteobacteria bacterium]|nr:type II toxin-antitoxin system RelE/ParE family toxin [Pseudomonadota bacterium]